MTIEQNKTIKPYQSKNYNNFYSYCKVKDENDNHIKSNGTVIKTKRIDKQKRRAYNQSKTQNQIVHQRLSKTNSTIRVPMAIKTRLLPPKRTNFHNSTEAPLFANTEEAQQAISHLLGGTQKQVYRPFVSSSVLTHYVEDVYQCLYSRHIEVLANTSVQPLTRRSLHIHNQQYLLEGARQQTASFLDTLKKCQSDASSINSDEGLIEAVEQISMDQTRVRVSSVKMNEGKVKQDPIHDSSSDDSDDDLIEAKEHISVEQPVVKVSNLKNQHFLVEETIHSRGTPLEDRVEQDHSNESSDSDEGLVEDKEHISVVQPVVKMSHLKNQQFMVEETNQRDTPREDRVEQDHSNESFDSDEGIVED